MIQVFKLICFGENKVENVQRIVVPTGAPGCRRRARLSAPFVRVLRSQFRVLLSTLLHGLSTPTQVINRKKSVNGGRAANSPGVAAAWRTPQACGIMGGPPEGSAVKVSTVSSRQPSTIPVIEIRPAGEGVGTVEGAQTALAGPEGLPARRRGQRLALCKETTDLLFTGKLGKDSRVSQDTPGENTDTRVR